MPRYRVDGRLIRAPMDLPLPVVPGGETDWTIQIERGAASDDLSGVTWTGAVTHEGRTWGRFGRLGEEAVIHLDAVATVVADVRGGRARIRHDQGADEDAGVLRHVLPYLGALRGRLLLHAASVVLPEGLVLLCAQAQTGKSTLAMALDALGYPVFGDDHVAVEFVDATAVGFASLPTIDTEQASRAAFFAAAAGAPGKVSAPCRTPRPEGPVPVHALVFLHRAETTRPQRVRASEVVRRLLLDVLFVGDPADVAEQTARFEGSAALAHAVPAYDLDLPEGLERLAAALPRLVAALRAPGAGAAAAPRSGGGA